MEHHYRKTLLDAIRARLDDLPGAGGAPLESIDEIEDQTSVPRACIRLSEEPISSTRTTSDDALRLSRTLGFSVILVARRRDDLELMAGEVERRMASDIDPDMRPMLRSTAFQDPKRGEFKFFALALNYDVEYQTDEGSPDRRA